MALAEFLGHDASLFIGLTGIAGLLVGSFLNVVAYRLPIMMERSWHQESVEYLGLNQTPEQKNQAFNLNQPPSQCIQCGTAIRPWQNIPVLSFLLLKGKCASCGVPISIRYPTVELLTAILSAAVAWKFGFTIQTAMGLILTWGLISLSLIDIDHQLLPDSITLPLLWLGLALSLKSVYVDSHSAIIGAICGYLSLWIVYQAFKMLTGKEGMGFGDFKLLGMLGAWMGWQSLPVIILLSSFVGALTGTLMIATGKHRRSAPIPFGPYLSAAGWVVLLWGEEFVQWYFALVG